MFSIQPAKQRGLPVAVYARRTVYQGDIRANTDYTQSRHGSRSKIKAHGLIQVDGL